MVKSRLVNVRMSKMQHELLIHRMECLGYRNISQYLRDCALRDDLATLKLLRDIHAKIIGGNSAS